MVPGVLTPGYDPVTAFIGALGTVGAPYAAVLPINFALLGSSIIAFATTTPTSSFGTYETATPSRSGSNSSTSPF